MRLTDDRRALAAEHHDWAVRLAASLARRFPAHVREDARAAGMLGLVEAACSFDPGRGVAFRVHAERRILGSMLDWARNEGAKGYRRRPDLAPEVGSLSWPVRIDLPAPDDPPDWGAEYTDLVRAYAHLSPVGPKGREILRLRYADAACSTDRSAGAAVGLSESRANQVVCAARAGYLEKAS